MVATFLGGIPAATNPLPGTTTFLNGLTSVSRLNPPPLDTNFGGLKYGESQAGVGYQNPTNVVNVQPQLTQALQNYSNFANSINGRLNLGRVNLNNNFLGPQAYQNQLNNGIDQFGQLGISEGLQNINLQRDTANNALSNSLLRQGGAGNQNLLAVLQNQNLMRSQLAANPLISQAQKDTAQRILDQINLQNANTQLQNQNQLQQQGFNQQSQLAELQARIAAGQPQQNLVDLLSNLQGQARGVTTGQSQVLGRNFKS